MKFSDIRETLFIPMPLKNGISINIAHEVSKVYLNKKKKYKTEFFICVEGIPGRKTLYQKLEKAAIDDDEKSRPDAELIKKEYEQKLESYLKSIMTIEEFDLDNE